MLIKWRKQCCLLDVFRASDRNKMFPTVVCLFLFTHTGTQGSQLEGPQNTLSIVGSTVTLKCSPPTKCNGTDWQKYVPGVSPVTVFKGPGTILNVVDKARYSVNDSSGCDLVIRNVQLKDAGRFICSAIMSSTQTTKTAYLIILETQPKCTLNASENNTVEGEGVQLNCEVTYNGTDKTSMDWKGVTDALAAVYNGSTISRPYSVVASAPKVPSFTCETSFSYETIDKGAQILGLATNSIPNATCSTSAINALYSVRYVTLSPLYSNYPPGTEITCAANGRPSPTFKWQEADESGTWMDIQNQNGSQFTMSNVSSKKYRCVAMNVVRTKSYNANSSEFQVNNTDATTTPVNAFVALIVPVAIGGGVGIGILLIVIVLICCFVPCCPCYKCCRSGDKEKISKEQQQPLTEYPDIYCNISDAQRDAPKAQPRSAPASEPPKLPQNAPPKAKPRTDNAKPGKPNDYQPIHEEVTYAELATETAPRQVAPKYKDIPQETLYADVGTA